MIMGRGAAGRRFAAVLLAGIVSTGALVASATPADAATGTLTVTTLDRNGKPTHEQVEIIDLHAGFPAFPMSGTAHRVRPGTYEVAADIFTMADQSDTVGVKRVKVTGGATKVTIDARSGRLVRAALRPAAPAGFVQHFQYAVCPAGATGAIGWSTGPRFYAIPSSLKDVELAVSSIWEPGNSTTASPKYVGVATSKGIPGAINRTFAQSGLTTVTIAGRSGLQSGFPEVSLRNSSADECRESALQLFTQATLPYRLTFHVPAGQWSVDQKAQEYVYGQPRTYAAGHGYTVTTGRASWGPNAHLPYTTSYGHRLYISTNQMFTDPSLSGGPNSARAHYVLTKGRQTLVRRTVTTDRTSVTKVLKQRGWYTLSVAATRHPLSRLPSTVLSPWTKLRLHFYADPAKSLQVRGYVARFVPAALGADNRARTRTTTIGLALLAPPPHDSDGKRQPNAVKRVRVWMSVNGGRTWKAVRVNNVKGKRSVTVTNPASGYVSLRASVDDTHGDWSVTVIGRAYAIG